MSYLRTNAVLLCLLISLPAVAQTSDDFTFETDRFYHSGLGQAENLGCSVAISGDRIVVGARYFGTAEEGRAIVLERVGESWVETEILYPQIYELGMQFGSAVDIAGDRIIVGAPGPTDTYVSGRAALFEYANGKWSQTELFGKGGIDERRFGQSVAITDEFFAIGAPSSDIWGQDAGAVYIYQFQEDGEIWGLGSTSSGNPPDTVGDYFGYSVDFDGYRMIVGAPLDDDGVDGAGDNRGYVHLWEYDPETKLWSSLRLGASDGIEEDNFGSAVAISGNRAVIGAPYDDDGELSSGSAYVFEYDGKTWVETGKLTASDGANLMHFGQSVAIDGDTIVIGSSNYQVDDGARDSVYIYELIDESWVEQKLVPTNVPPLADFGEAVAVSHRNVVVGVPGYEEKSGADIGAAVMYSRYAVYNEALEKFYYDLDSALGEAGSGDRFNVRSAAFEVDGIVDARNLALTFIGVEPITFGQELLFLPGNGSSFRIIDGFQSGHSVEGQIVAPEGGSLIFSDIDCRDGAQLYQNDCTLIIDESMSTSGGVAYLSDEILAAEVSTSGTGTNRVIRDAEILGDYNNQATTIVHRGTLYIYGDLVNDGVLVGEVDTGPGFSGDNSTQPGDGFSIGGNYTVGQSATLSMSDPVWWLRVGGDLDVAINNPSNFTMSEATIELNGLAPGKFQALEALSADLGADEAGYDPSNFPIGTIRITSGSTTQLVNNHVNTIDAPCEVLYVNELVVAAGGELITNGCPIYARSATIDGTVDDPNAIIIVEETPDCLGDIDGDGVVNGADLAILLGAWATDYPAADLDGNGIINGADLVLVLGSWGICP